MAAETKTKNNQSWLGSIRSYIVEVRNELQKVTWPTTEEVISLTRIVIIVTIITSLFLGGLSIFLTFFIDQIGFEYPIIMVILFVGFGIGAWWMFRREDTKSY